MTQLDCSMGTTLIAVDYEDGVMVATDSQTSSGSFIANRAADKITPISKFAVCCRSGSAADTQSILHQLKFEARQHSILSEKEMNIRAIVQIFRKLCYKEKKQLNYGFICAGWDLFHGGQIYTITQGGAILRRKLALSGSGSLFINAFCDANFREKMKRKECKNFLGRAISLAILRDGSTGGVVRLCNISNSGIERSIFFPDSKINKKVILKYSFDILV
mmetsp:Transcript_8092/g.16134  ORF Transcript_8092/g.16134 Transcript_8092/m.16134 type:complete len:219 (+) Transcript_8092:355-1011(+)